MFVTKQHLIYPSGFSLGLISKAPAHHFQGLYSEFGMVKPGKGKLCPPCFCIFGLSVAGNKESLCKPFCGGDGRPALSRISAERNKHEINNE